MNPTILSSCPPLGIIRSRIRAYGSILKTQLITGMQFRAALWAQLSAPLFGS